jgi:hypothetical protein
MVHPDIVSLRRVLEQALRASGPLLKEIDIRMPDVDYTNPPSSHNNVGSGEGGAANNFTIARRRGGGGCGADYGDNSVVLFGFHLDPRSLAAVAACDSLQSFMDFSPGGMLITQQVLRVVRETVPAPFRRLAKLVAHVDLDAAPVLFEMLHLSGSPMVLLVLCLGVDEVSSKETHRDALLSLAQRLPQLQLLELTYPPVTRMTTAGERLAPAPVVAASDANSPATAAVAANSGTGAADDDEFADVTDFNVLHSLAHVAFLTLNHVSFGMDSAGQWRGLLQGFSRLTNFSLVGPCSLPRGALVIAGECCRALQKLRLPMSANTALAELAEVPLPVTTSGGSRAACTTSLVFPELRILHILPPTNVLADSEK